MKLEDFNPNLRIYAKRFASRDSALKNKKKKGT